MNWNLSTFFIFVKDKSFLTVNSIMLPARLSGHFTRWFPRKPAGSMSQPGLFLDTDTTQGDQTAAGGQIP